MGYCNGLWGSIFERWAWLAQHLCGLIFPPTMDARTSCSSDRDGESAGEGAMEGPHAGPSAVNSDRRKLPGEPAKQGGCQVRLPMLRVAFREHHEGGLIHYLDN